MDPTRLAIAALAASLTDTTMQGVQPCVMDPTLKDPSIAARLSMQMEVFTAWWNWLVKQALPTSSKLPAPEAVNFANLLNPSQLGSLGPIVSAALAAIPGGKAIAPVASAVLDAISAPMPAATPAVAAK